eukprot:maker-scaffold995_size72343-snap-gene-0.20 protein:Tk07625 transcript:maker-scaffold995_size72343-snap-gene-0.20-mRNA-1 annotation:"jmjc domain-containing protein 4-like isoform 1"
MPLIELQTSIVEEVSAAQCMDASFPTVDEPMSYDEFFHQFILPNRPCLIRNGSIDQWQSRKDWRTQSGQPDLRCLSRIVPKGLTVPVSICDEQYFNSQQCVDMSFEDYVADWEAEAIGSSKYLKDWHFHRDCPEYPAYTTPKYFCSDWLNEYWERNASSADGSPGGDDYRFVYIGPRGSWTPLHFDVFGSFSWSANIVGRKHWIFFPPSERKHLTDPFGNLYYDVESASIRDVPALFNIKQRFDVVQNEGEIVFVPSLWIHQVKNLEPTISINHNWFNGANVMEILLVLLDAQHQVEKEMDDCRAGTSLEDWEEMCEKLLRANHGMHLTDFCDLLLYIGERRVQGLNDPEIIISFDDRVLGPRHCQYDLDRVKLALSRLSLSASCPRAIITRVEQFLGK